MAFWGSDARFDAMMAVPDLERRGLIVDGTRDGLGTSSKHWEIRLTPKGRAFIENANGAPAARARSNAAKARARLLAPFKPLRPSKLARRWPRSARYTLTALGTIKRLWRGLMGR